MAAGVPPGAAARPPSFRSGRNRCARGRVVSPVQPRDGARVVARRPSLDGARSGRHQNRRLTVFTAREAGTRLRSTRGDLGYRALVRRKVGSAP